MLESLRNSIGHLITTIEYCVCSHTAQQNITHGDSKSRHLSASKGINIIVNSIWIPLAGVLSSTCSTAFTSGNVTVFHRSYIAIDKFINGLSQLCSNHSILSSSKHQMSILSRLMQHTSMSQFQQKWSIDLYFQVRHLILYITTFSYFILYLASCPRNHQSH